MFDKAKSDGAYPYFAAGYRTQEKQQQLLDEKIQSYQSKGHSKLVH